jgi:hypothetical protein
MKKREKELELREVNEETRQSETPSECAFCSLLCRNAAHVPADPTPSLSFMTERELRVLASMRRLKEEVREVKASMREGKKRGDVPEEGAGLETRLEGLNAEWKRLEQERSEAAEERMRLLGHIQ